MNIIHKIFNPHNSWAGWLLSIGIVLIMALLVVGQDMDAWAASRRNGIRRKDGRALTRVQSSTAVVGTGRRVALVIGNATYKDTNDRLFNPTNDADDITRDLQGFGFTVTTGKNLSKKAMKRVIADFGRSASNAEVALFFYAGHGVQSKGQNYLIPVDAEVLSEADLTDEGVNLNLPLEELDNAKSRVNIVILDACRNNSFTGNFRGTKLRGLAQPASAPKGTVIVYATDPGNVAADGSGRNGLFTEGLRIAMEQGSDLSLDGVLTVASEHVEAKSNGTQSPYVNGPKTLQKRFFFAGASVDNSPQPEKIAPVVERPQVVEEPEPSIVIKPTRKSFEPETVAIPAGSFEMGSPDSEAGRSSDEGPVHTVNIKAFRMGKYEVTRGQFRAFVDATSYKTEAEQGDGCYGWNGSGWEKKAEFNWLNMGFAQEDNHPVACVSWNDGVAYTEWLSEQTGKSYRLPSEAEWEYAARAGTTTARYWGNNPNQACKYANVADQIAKSSWQANTIHECDDGYGFTSPVGQFKANAFKMYDMLGNVWEWTCSQYDSNGYSGTETTCANKGNSVARAVRGGAWFNGPTGVRAAVRGFNAPADRDVSVGIRLVQD